MLNETPPAGAGALRVTVNVALVVPLVPSMTDASPIERTAGPPQGLVGEAELRGAGVATAKSAALSSVSVQPKSSRNAAVVVEIAAVGPDPSKKLAAP